jgi:hypothetical protein
VIGYTSRTGTATTLAALREAGWRLLVVAGAVLRNEGFRYGLDNGAWSYHERGVPFDEAAFLLALRRFGAKADFVVVPDIVAGGKASLDYSLSWLPRVRSVAKRQLIAVQDGMTPDDLRPVLRTLSVGIFVGGTTEWKLATLPEWGRLAQETGCYLHVGRVNSRKRILLCAQAGAHSFDGTSPIKFPSTLPLLEAARREACRMKTITHLSASQMETFEESAGGCNRKWYLNKVVGLPIPQAASAALGEATHKELETWLETGETRHLGPIARAALTLGPVLPKPGAVVVESNGELPLVDGIKFVLRIDVLDFQSDPAVPRVVDWKTTSNFQYLKSSEELRRAIQMLGYAKYALTYYPADATPKTVKVAHVGLLTRGSPQARYTEATLDVSEIESGWTRLQQLGRRMKEVSLLESPAQVRANKSVCQKYGGCPFKNQCAGIDGAAAPSPFHDPTAKENVPMPLPPAIAAKLGLANKAATPAAEPEKKGGVIPADAPKVLTAAQIEAYAAQKKAGTATGVVPPDAPAPAKEERKEAAALAAAVAKPVETAQTPAPAPAPAEPVDVARGYGWTDEEIDAMSDEAFIASQKIRKEDADVTWDEDDQGRFIDAIVEKPKPVVTAPRRASRTQAAAPAPVVEEKTDYPEKGYIPPAQVQEMIEEKVAEMVADEAPKPAKRKAGRPPVYEQHLKGLYGWSVDQLVRITRPQGEALFEAKIRGDQVSITPDGVVHVLGEEPFRLLPDGTPAAVETTKASASAPKAEPVAAPPVEKTTLSPETKEQVKKFLTSETKIVGTSGQADTFPNDVEPRWSNLSVVGLRVFVDILPEKGVESVTLLDEILKPYMADAAAKNKNEKTGAPDPVTHYSLIPFAQGPSRVAAYLLVNPPKGDVFVDSKSPCAAACLEVLRPMADVVYRGVR